MEKNEKKRINRVRNLVIVIALTAIMLTVSTFAWFVGMRTVNVTSFDVEIATTESLQLSLDGDDWKYEVAINSTNFKTASYTDNTNSWGGEKGLIPMSSVGDMDSDVSRMKLYEKASYTPTPGGYRLLASRVDNYKTDQTEQNGYVAFDLFIRNYTGTQYLEALNIEDEEAIYLTTDSAVTVTTAGGGVENTGIENSVRIAFAQIGRVKGTETTQGTITGITCTGGTGVTGICRTAHIWEPNDTKHVNAAIDWYEESCLARKNVGSGSSLAVGSGSLSTINDIHDPDNYYGSSTPCGAVVDGTAYDTYAISDDITSAEHVNIYDGLDYNGYTGSPKLQAYDYFTDSEKILKSVNRPQFMTLAPNSITKVRVYIYIEGQDIDNYEFAQIGKKMQIKFGFTKERFTIEDIDYEGPSGSGLPRELESES